MRTHLVLVGILFAFVSKAQNEEYFDSLQAILPTLEETAQVDAIVGMPYDKMTSNFARSGDLLNQAYDLARSIGYSEGQATVLTNLGIIRYLQGNYDRSLEHQLEAITIFQELGMTAEEGKTYCDIGYQMKRRDLPKAKRYMQLGISLLEGLADNSFLEPAYGNYGVLVQMSGDLDSAIHYYEMALAISSSKNDSIAIPFSLNKLGEAYALKGNFDEARAVFDEAFNIRFSRNDQYGIMENYTFYGDLYYYQDQFDSALVYYELAMDMSEIHGYPYMEQYCHQMISATYAGMGEYEMALAEHQLYVHTKDSLMDEQRNAQIAELELRFETTQKEKENLLLKQEKSEVELANSIQRTTIIGLSLGAAALLFGALFLLQRIKRNKDVAIIAEREAGIRAVFSAQEEERSRISKDLHDGVGQQLTGIKMGFERLYDRVGEQDETSRKDLDLLKNVIDESADEVRTISHQLLPKTLTSFGLRPALQDLLDSTGKLSGVQCSLDASGLEERMPSEVELALYRVCQEAVSNSIKHAEATHIKIRTDIRSGVLSMEILDDGKGFDTSKLSTGHGLTNMQNRIRTIGGKFFVESGSDGTIISINIAVDG